MLDLILQPLAFGFMQRAQFHIGGSLLGLIPHHVGARDVIMPETAPTEILHLISTEHVTLAFFVPALMLFLLQTPGCQEEDFPV